MSEAKGAFLPPLCPPLYRPPRPRPCEQLSASFMLPGVLMLLLFLLGIGLTFGGVFILGSGKTGVAPEPLSDLNSLAVKPASVEPPAHPPPGHIPSPPAPLTRHATPSPSPQTVIGPTAMPQPRLSLGRPDPNSAHDLNQTPALTLALARTLTLILTLTLSPNANLASQDLNQTLANHDSAALPRDMSVRSSIASADSRGRNGSVPGSADKRMHSGRLKCART